MYSLGILYCTGENWISDLRLSIRVTLSQTLTITTIKTGPDKGAEFKFPTDYGVITLHVSVSHHHSVMSMLISSASLFAYYETLNNVSIITNECSVKLFSYNDLKPALLRRY